MVKHTLTLLAAVTFFACTEKKPASTSAPTSVMMAEKNNRQCVKDTTICAEVMVQYPILSGGNTANTLNPINDALREMALAGLVSNPKLPVEQALDSVIAELYPMLEEQVKMSPDWGAGFFKEVTTKTLMNTSKFVSFEMASSGFAGGAHPYYSAALVTYDLNTGKTIGLPDVVRDTTALRPMLEKGFVEAKKEGMPDATLADLLFPDITQLPISANVCLVPQGLRFLYNPYEVASWAVGPTEITLTWEQLGALADRKKWVD